MNDWARLAMVLLGLVIWGVCGYLTGLCRGRTEKLEFFSKLSLKLAEEAYHAGEVHALRKAQELIKEPGLPIEISLEPDPAAVEEVGRKLIGGSDGDGN